MSIRRMSRDAPPADPAAPPRPPSLAHRAALRVLIVDDHTDAADLLGELLELEGHECTVVYNGPAAIQAACRRSHDLAMIDIELPQMDGYALARALRAAARPPPVLVAVTGRDRPDEVAEMLAAGFHDHLRKPLALDLLTGLLARVAAGAEVPASRARPGSGEQG